jgi:hypothetical protein
MLCGEYLDCYSVLNFEPTYDSWLLSQRFVHNKYFNWLRNLMKRNCANKTGRLHGINQSVKLPVVSWVAYEFGFDPR